MRFLPASGPDRLGLALFPFKAYLVLAPVCLWVWRMSVGNRYVRGGLSEATIAILPGYFLCMLVFFAVALVQFVQQEYKKSFNNILIAAAAVLVLLVLLPLSAR
jgi:hypothetical protein